MKYGVISGIIILGLSGSSAYAADNQSIQPSVGNQMQTTADSKTANQTADQAFLIENKTKPGVVTLPDGLQYKVVKEGNGEIPASNDIVTVNYSGKLIDGKEFDSSYKRGEPASFPVNGVIAGWTEALQRMKVGSVWELYIPAELAYGAAGVPPVIGPNQTLIFTVELLGIKKS